MEASLLKNAIDLIASRSALHGSQWETGAIPGEVYHWPGADNEEILVEAYRKARNQITWDSAHRHDFYYFIYLLQGSYSLRVTSRAGDITLHQGDILLGQPNSELRSMAAEAGTVIVNLLLRKEVFIHSFLQMLSTSEKLFPFFMEPVKTPDAGNCLFFHVADNGMTTGLIEMITVEYAFRQQDSQELLKPLTLAFIKQLSRLYALESQPKDNGEVARPEKIYQYMYDHMAAVSLRSLSEHFGLHPSYMSTMLRRETGLGYTELLQDMRMQRTEVLLKNTTLTVEPIANLLGYFSTSSFYSAFKKRYDVTPRVYLEQRKG